MKKIIVILSVLIMSFGMTLSALDFTTVSELSNNDEMFMDMAVSAAKKSAASNNPAAGAVIIRSGAWRSTGTPDADKTAEEVAYIKSRLSNLAGASVYTVNEPITMVVNLLNSLGVDAIYFSNTRDEVVAAGVYPASAYNDDKLDKTVKQAPVIRLIFEDASMLLK